MSNFLFIRHLDKAHEPHRYSDENMPLSEKGHAQGRLLEKKLSEFLEANDITTVNALISSPFKRALQTAHYVRKATHQEMPMIVHPDIGEINLGKAFGKPHENVLEEFPQYRENCEKVGALKAPLPGGESSFDVKEGRAAIFLRYLEIFPEGSTTIIVTHSGFMQCVLWNIMQWDLNQATSMFESEKLAPFGGILWYTPKSSEKLVVPHPGQEYHSFDLANL